MGTDVKSGSRAEATLCQRLIQTLGDEPLTRGVLVLWLQLLDLHMMRVTRKGRVMKDLLSDKERKSTEKV